MKKMPSLQGVKVAFGSLRAIAAYLTFALCLLSGPSFAQQVCPPPPALTNGSAKNIFTPQQEIDLGDILAEMTDQGLSVVHDDELAAHANDIVKKLVGHLPPNQLDFRVFLYNLPVVNSLSISGGRIYVSRKMVAFLRSDDELAALLSHEMGHILTHQSAIEMTLLLHDVLGVDSVGDRKDISDKVNKLFDNLARNPGALQRVAEDEERNQEVADKMGLYTLASAGYSPQTLLEFFDRLAETHGKTGNVLSDIFGEKKPNEIRLRGMHKALETLTASCSNASSFSSNDEFLDWQARVIAYVGSGRKESMVGVTEVARLDPPLRTDINYLRFSPNGQYALAQDDSSVFVFSHEPFRLLFRIEAPDARPAQFSPDSQKVVILTQSLRLEIWDVESEERSGLHEFSIPGGCTQSVLTHDGTLLACASPDLDLALYDSVTDQQVFQKKKVFEPQSLRGTGEFERDWVYYLDALGSGSWIKMSFSPDDRYLVAVGLDPAESIAIDVRSRSQVSLPSSIRDRLTGGFTFLSPSEIVVRDMANPAKSPILDFPSGKTLEEIPIDRHQTFRAPSHGNYLILAPVKAARVGVLDLASQKFVLGLNQSAAIDVYDQTALAENASGELGLYDLSTHKPQALLRIPESPLGRLQAFTTSPDLHWLAFSANSRGGVWDLQTSQCLYSIRGFRGSYFDGNAAFYADFPKLDAQARTVAHATLSGRSISPGITIDEHALAWQYGQFLVLRKPLGKNNSPVFNVSLEIQDARDGHSLWTRTFPKEVPTLDYFPPFDSLVLEWPVEFQGAKEEIKKNPALQSRFAAIRDRNSSTLIDVLEMKTGEMRGQILVDTGKRSFEFTRAYSEGDWVLVGDSENRTHVYSLSTGEEKASIFGTNALLSAAANMLLIENETGQVDVYDLKSLDKRNHLTFHYAISGWAFSEDGKRLLVLSANQRAYIFDTQALDRPENAQSSVAAQR